MFEVWTVGHVRHVSLRFLILRELVGTGHHLQLGMCHLHMGQVLRGKGDGIRHLGFVLKDGGISLSSEAVSPSGKLSISSTWMVRGV